MTSDSSFDEDNLSENYIFRAIEVRRAAQKQLEMQQTMDVGNGCLANGGLPDYHGHGGKDHHEDQPQLLDLYGDSHHDGHDWRSGKQMLAEWLPGTKPQNGRLVSWIYVDFSLLTSHLLFADLPASSSQCWPP